MLLASCRRLVANIIGYSSSSGCLGAPAAGLRVLGPSGTAQQSTRQFASKDDIEEEINYINEKFAEAREEIEFAREDADTVYFNESAGEARRAVNDVLGRWRDLLAKVTDDEQAKLQRSMGLKLEQLKAELQELDEIHA